MPNYSADAVENGKYYYNVTNVVVATHGSKDQIVTKTGNITESLYASYRTGADTIEKLADIRIGTLNLFACSCAEDFSMRDTIAEDFIEKKYLIRNVIAFDTKLVNLFTPDQYYYYGRWFRNVFYIDFDEYTLIKSKNEDYDTILLNSISQMDTPCGFVKFSRETSPIDIFNDDIHFGELKTYYGAKEGILYKNRDWDDNKHNDPVLEME